MSEIFAHRDEWIAWLTGPGLRVVIILGAAMIATVLSRRAIVSAVRPEMLGLPVGTDPLERERRERREATVESFLMRAVFAFIWLAAVFMIASEIGINTGPLLASAGVVGLAVGFGTQTFVRDAIAGLFLMLENHYDVGDRVRLNGIEGRVSSISLRRTTLESDDAAVHTIPNGAITLTTNLSRVSPETA